jgi:hypothetical protein
MKWILFICLLTLSVIYSCKQQGTNNSRTASKECLYHIKLYNWQWDYCKFIGYDTIPKYSKTTGDHIGDTIIWDTSFVALSHSDLKLPFPFPASFINSPQQLSVTSCDGAKSYNITAFDFVSRDNGQSSMTIGGSTIPPDGLQKIKELAESDTSVYEFFIEAHLKDKKDVVETSYSVIKINRQ